MSRMKTSSLKWYLFLLHFQIAANHLSGDISLQEENQIYMDLSRREIGTLTFLFTSKNCI